MSDTPEEPHPSGIALWVWEYLRATAIAAWLGAAVFLLIVLWQQWAPNTDYRVIVWLSTAPFLLLAGLGAIGIAFAARVERDDAPTPITYRWPMLVATALVLAVVSWPVPSLSNVPTGFGQPDDVLYAVSTALAWSFPGNGYYISILATLLVLWWWSRGAGTPSRGARQALALLYFAYILTDTSPDLLFVPASLILALILFRPLVFSSQGNREKVRNAEHAVRSRRARLLERQLAATTSPVGRWSVFARRLRLGPAHTDAQSAPFVLSIGPRYTDWKNGVYAAIVGALVTLPWTVPYVAAFALRSSELWGPVMLVEGAFTVIDEPLFWASQAFFLGYFFSDIRGSSGIQKGLRLGLVFAICALPLWLTSIRTDAEALMILLRICVEVTAMTITGLVLDVTTIREALGDRFKWVDVARLTGAKSLTALTSFGVASLSVGAATVLTGEFVTVATLALQAAGVPGPATHH